MEMSRSGLCATVLSVMLAALLVHGVAAQVAEDSGWYFTETEIGVPFRPSDFQPGANIVNRVEEVVAICPFGFVSSGCIASTVPPAIANIDIGGPVDVSQPAPLLSVQPDAEVSGFNVFTGCSATARFNTVIDTEYINAVAQSGVEGSFFTVFLKVQAFCVPAFTPLPSPPPPVPTPVVDPCSCRNRSPPLGCERNTLCPSNTICYVDQPCPGFLPSSVKPGLFYDCIPFGIVGSVCG